MARELDYVFRDPALHELALSHRSVGARNNERLEFLGDSLVNLHVAELLFEQVGMKLLDLLFEGRSDFVVDLVRGSATA